MASADFHHLCAELCERLGVACPELAPEPTGLSAMSLRLHGVDLSLVERLDGAQATLLVLVEFGAPPTARELAVWQALAEANFLMLAPQAPAFSRNPANGEVVLQYACPLAQAQAAGLHRGLLEMTELALRWRDFFEAPADDRPAPTEIRFA